jgi:ADP-ribose pyrophosphatase
MPEFELVDGAVQWEGRVIRAGLERYRYPDGEEVSRDKVWHPGAVAILAVDDTHVWLCRQPREAANLSASLEVPAGKRDVPGEPPLATAKRELVEEVGKEAAVWRELLLFCTSPGFSDERVWLYLATELSDAPGGAAPDEDERLEIVPWPLHRLQDAIAESEDSKSLIALLWLAAQPRDGPRG